MNNSDYATQAQNFAKYGFINSPFDEAEWHKIVGAGLTQYAHEIGCDLSCEAFENIDEAVEWYLKREA